MAVAESVAAGQAALEAGRWVIARASFEAALKDEETAAALLGMGKALWWLGEPRQSLEYCERAYVAFRRSDDAFGAARTAMWLCLAYKADFGNRAAASGWLARAESALRDADPAPLLGWLWVTRAYETTDLWLSIDLAGRSLELARRSCDLELELCALSQLGHSLVAAGQVREGLVKVDEAMAGALSGERYSRETVMTACCHMLSACELAGDIERAADWCRVADEFIREHGCPFLYVSCRALYGSILVRNGRWAEAESELEAAIRNSGQSWPAMHAQAVARLADLRLRQGRPEEAAAILSTVDDDLATALPAAKLLLTRGEAAIAAALLGRRLNLLGETHIEAAQTLELLADAHLARGDRDAASETTEWLIALASVSRHDLDVACASTAAGRVALARGEPDVAIRCFESALERYSRLELPFEAARARLDLARALVDHEPTVATAEARKALAAYDQLGAAADADAAAAHLRSLGVTGRPGPKRGGLLTRREAEVLRLVGLGLTNPEIAERLFISRKTAAHHVSSVLAKLDLRNRAEAVAYLTRTHDTPRARRWPRPG